MLGIENLKDSVGKAIGAMLAFYNAKQEDSPGGSNIKPREWIDIGKESVRAVWDGWRDHDDIGDEFNDLTPEETQEIFQYAYDTWNSSGPIRDDEIHHAVRLTVEALISSWKATVAWTQISAR